jgi:hypothetical protein
MTSLYVLYAQKGRHPSGTAAVINYSSWQKQAKELLAASSTFWLQTSTYYILSTYTTPSESDCHQICRLLPNTKFHYHVHKSQLLVFVLCRMNSAHRPILILFSQLRLDLPSSLFLSDLSFNVLHACFLTIAYPAHSLDFTFLRL